MRSIVRLWLSSSRSGMARPRNERASLALIDLVPSDRVNGLYPL